jgi:hypothetical protein
MLQKVILRGKGDQEEAWKWKAGEVKLSSFLFHHFDVGLELKIIKQKLKISLWNLIPIVPEESANGNFLFPPSKKNTTHASNFNTCSWVLKNIIPSIIQNHLLCKYA